MQCAGYDPCAFLDAPCFIFRFQLLPDVSMPLILRSLYFSAFYNDQAVNRGVVSPAGHSFVGEIKEKDGLLSVQRVVLDEKVVEAAVREGVSFKDSTQVKVRAFIHLSLTVLIHIY